MTSPLQKGCCSISIKLEGKKRQWNGPRIFWHIWDLSFFKKKKKFYLFLTVLSLWCYTKASCSCGEQGTLQLWCLGFSWWRLLLCEHRLLVCRLRSCDSRALEQGLSSHGAQAELPCGMWNLPGSGMEPVFPALTGGFLSTGPPGKFHIWYLLFIVHFISLTLSFHLLKAFLPSLHSYCEFKMG